jgi:hypothetical protein
MRNVGFRAMRIQPRWRLPARRACAPLLQFQEWIETTHNEVRQDQGSGGVSHLLGGTTCDNNKYIFSYGQFVIFCNMCNNRDKANIAVISESNPHRFNVSAFAKTIWLRRLHTRWPAAMSFSHPGSFLNPPHAAVSFPTFPQRRE